MEPRSEPTPRQGRAGLPCCPGARVWLPHTSSRSWTPTATSSGPSSDPSRRSSIVFSAIRDSCPPLDVNSHHNLHNEIHSQTTIYTLTYSPGVNPRMYRSPAAGWTEMLRTRTVRRRGRITMDRSRRPPSPQHSPSGCGAFMAGRPRFPYRRTGTGLPSWRPPASGSSPSLGCRYGSKAEKIWKYLYH